MNVHRWRKLEGSDPNTYSMIQRAHALQKTLIRKTEEVAAKDALIQQKEKLYVPLPSHAIPIPHPLPPSSPTIISHHHLPPSSPIIISHHHLPSSSPTIISHHLPSVTGTSSCAPFSRDSLGPRSPSSSTSIRCHTSTAPRTPHHPCSLHAARVPASGAHHPCPPPSLPPGRCSLRPTSPRRPSSSRR
jgi:hypothetical protein